MDKQPKRTNEFSKEHPLLTATATGFSLLALTGCVHQPIEVVDANRPSAIKTATNESNLTDVSANSIYPLEQAEELVVFGAYNHGVGVLHSPNSKEPCDVTEDPIDLPNTKVWVTTDNDTLFMGIPEATVPQRTLDACRTDADGIFWVIVQDEDGNDLFING